MLNKKNLTEEFLEFANDIPHTIFEVVYNTKTNLSRINFLNQTGKLFSEKIIDDSAFKNDFKLQELFSSKEHLLDIINFIEDLHSTDEIIIRNREYLLNAKNGKQILIQASFKVKKDKENIIVRGLLCEKSEIIKKEIPKSKSLAHFENIEEEVENLKDFFNAFDALIMTLNEEGRILFVSPNIGNDILYRPREEIIGKKLVDIFTKGQAEFFTEQCKEVFEKGEANSFEYHLPIDNKLLWFQCRIIPVHIKDGKFTQIVAIIRDITKWRLGPITNNY